MSFGCLIVIFFVMHFAENANSARILAVLPLPAYSHFNAFEQIAKALADKGHQVDMISHYPQKNPYRNFTDIINLSKQMPSKMNTLKFEFLHDNSGAGLFYKEFGTDVCLLMNTPEMQKLIKEPPQDPPYDLVFIEQFFANCYFALGRHLKVPLVAFASTKLFPFMYEPLGQIEVSAISPDTEYGSIIHMDFWQRFKNTWDVHKSRRETQYYTDIQTSVVRDIFGKHMPDIRELERDISLLLINAHFTLDGIRPVNPGIVEIGGVHVKDDQSEWPVDLEKYLDESNDGFVYISFGSLLKFDSFPKAQLAGLCSALKRLAPIRFLLKIETPKVLPNVPDNVRTLSWIPQIKVLKHKNIRAFVTHGGRLSTLEAVTFGVPLIGVPMYGDQPVNVHNCVEKGIAYSLDFSDFTEEGIFKAISTVVFDPSYKANMKAISAQFLDRPLSARDTAVYWIEYILRNGGDSLRSPGTKLTWWQLGLLDVYGSMAAAALLALYVLIKLISLAYGFLSWNTKPSKSPKKQD